MRKSETEPPVADFSPPRLADIAPSQSGPGTLPTGLAQPPLSPHTSSKTSALFMLLKINMGIIKVLIISLL